VTEFLAYATRIGATDSTEAPPTLLPDGAQRELAAASEAIARHAWPQALKILRRLDQQHLLGPQELEQLAVTEWWTGNLEATIHARERAYQGWTAQQEAQRAARVALDLAKHYAAKLSNAAAKGWRRRAGRLLKELPESPEHGYLLLYDLWDIFRADAPEEGIRTAERAAELGARFGDRDLEVMALAELGRVLIHAGRVDDGLELEEEACAAALGGELGPVATAVTFCSAISTSRELTDFGRAGELSAAAKHWCEGQAIEGFPGVCRVYRAEVMRVRGEWVDAEREIRRACQELRTFSPNIAAAAFRELGEIRLRAGDLAGAEEALALAQELGYNAQPGQARLLLAQGKPRAALHGLQAAIAKPSISALDRAHVQPLLAEAGIGAGDLATAREAADELRETAGRYGTAVLRAMSAWTDALVTLADDHLASAIDGFRRAIALYQEADMPYEAAESRLRLGTIYARQGDAELAEVELRAAKQVFDRLGAIRAAQAAADELLRLRGEVAEATRTFMFTDIVRSTNLLEAIGDRAWHDLVSWHDETLRRAFAEHAGEEIDHAGDGFFVAFDSPERAVACAIAIQRQLGAHRREHGFAPEVRIGLHAADATLAAGNYRGMGVHAAARIAALGTGGEIVASASTVQAVDGVRVANPREATLKGIAHPVPVVSVDWRTETGA
jgi:class 3 adenylate cyclase